MRLAILLPLLLMSSPLFANQAYYLGATLGEARVRPTKGGDSAALLPANTELRIYRITDGWAEIGYVPLMGLQHWEHGWLPKTQVRTKGGARQAEPGCAIEVNSGSLVCVTATIASVVCTQAPGAYCQVKFDYRVEPQAMYSDGTLFAQVSCMAKLSALNANNGQWYSLQKDYHTIPQVSSSHAVKGSQSLSISLETVLPVSEVKYDEVSCRITRISA